MKAPTRPTPIARTVLGVALLTLALAVPATQAQVCTPFDETLSEGTDTVLVNDFCDSEIEVDCEGDQDVSVLVKVQLNGRFGVNLRCSTPDGAKLCIFDSTCGDLGAAAVRSEVGIVDVTGDFDSDMLSILVLDIGAESLCGEGTNVSCAGNWGSTEQRDFNSFNSSFEVPGFTDWTSRVGGGSTSAGGRLSHKSSALPLGIYESDTAGEHRAELEGPPDADFDLTLQWWNGAEWLDVAKGISPGSTEAVAHTGPPGRYRWRVAAERGAGAFLLKASEPEKSRLASGLTQDSDLARTGNNSLRAEYENGTKAKDFLVDQKPQINGGESRYQASFYIRPSADLVIKGKKHQVFEVAHPSGNKTQSTAMVLLRTKNGNPQLRVKVRENSGNKKSPWTTIASNDWTHLEVVWRAASDPDSTDGSMAVEVGDETVWTQVLKNGTHEIVEAKLGQIKGAKRTNQGVVHYDEFRSSWNN